MNQKRVNPVTRAYRRYFVEFWISMTAYVAAMWVRNWLLYGAMKHADRTWQIVIALMPIVPAGFLFAAIVRLLRGTDELYRRICVDSLALAGGVTALLAVTYGLIEGESVPRLSAWWTYSVFMVAWIIATPFVRRRYR